jgi:hypothetical protein
MYEYIPNGRRKVIRPKKRWRDQHPLRRNKPENGFTLSLLVMSTNYEAPQCVIISIALLFSISPQHHVFLLVHIVLGLE